MFSSLKDKLLNKVPLPLFPSASPSNSGDSLSINEHVGASILSHYQKQWEIIHGGTEQNAQKAQEVATMIENITSKIEAEKVNLGLMCHILNNSNLRTNITNCTVRLENVYSSVDSLESQLLKLEDLIESVQVEKMKKEHRYHLQQYKVKKAEGVLKFESMSKQMHEQKLAEHDLKKQQDMLERQQVFQEAFRNDLEAFKNLGVISKIDLPSSSAPKKQPSALLEEIEVEYDENELDQFFNEQKDESQLRPSESK